VKHPLTKIETLMYIFVTRMRHSYNRRRHALPLIDSTFQHLSFCWLFLLFFKRGLVCH